MSNRLAARDIPLFWTLEELGPMRSQIESAYSKGVPITSIIKRCLPARTREGKRPLSYADIYAVLLEAVRQGRLVQRHNCNVDEMPVATFRHFFNTFKDGGSLQECMLRISAVIPPDKPGETTSPAYTSVEVCRRMFRVMSERWRTEVRKDAQAFINKPKREPLAARPNMEMRLPHDIAAALAKKVYDLVMSELTKIADVPAAVMVDLDKMALAKLPPQRHASITDLPPLTRLNEHATNEADLDDPEDDSVGTNDGADANDANDTEAEDFDIGNLADEDEIDKDAKKPTIAIDSVEEDVLKNIVDNISRSDDPFQ